MKADKILELIYELLQETSSSGIKHVDRRLYYLRGKAIDELKELQRLAEIGEALEWSRENKQSSWVSIADTPTGSFCDGLDIEFLLKLFNEKEEINVIF